MSKAIKTFSKSFKNCGVQADFVALSFFCFMWRASLYQDYTHKGLRSWPRECRSTAPEVQRRSPVLIKQFLFP